MTDLNELDRQCGISLCRFRVDDDVFGIETASVQEALHRCELREVPLAPAFVAGVLAYRGEVLLAVSFRALLGLPPNAALSSAVVLRDAETGELFALLLDALLDVAEIPEDAWEPNPATLDERRSLLFAGVYRTAGTPLVRLDPERLQPSCLVRQLPTGRRMGERR